jgi:uncharacterized protein YjdB
MKKVFVFLGLACTIGMASCDDKDEKDVALTDITVTPSSVRGEVGSITTLKATAVPEGAAATFVWTSQNEAVATVDQNGAVTIKSVDSTTVTVASGSISKTVPVVGIIVTIPLVSITVTPATVERPVDDTVRIVATPSPANADGVNFVWTSTDEEIAMVDGTGLITITGVGSTTVIVTSGSVSSTVEVKGTIKGVSVLNAEGEESGQATPGSVFQLNAVVAPEGLGLAPDKWESSAPDIAEVDQTGLVTVKDVGIATITAFVGDFSGAYTLSTVSPLDQAYGYWTFDDPTSWGKATKGSDLDILGTINQVDGPSAANLAIEGVRGERTMSWNHEKSDADSPKEWTFMWDARFFATRTYFSLYWNGVDGDCCLFVRWRKDSFSDAKLPDVVYPNDTPLLTIGRGGYVPIMEPLEEGTWSPWFRIIYTFQISADGTFTLTCYIDGKKLFYDNMNHNMWWNEGKPIYFSTDAGDTGGDGDDAPYPIASIAAWDRMLTEQEIAFLGSVK